MDKIIVRTNTDMQRVIEWADRLVGAQIQIAFPEAEIEFQEEDIVLRFRDESQDIVWFEAEMAGRKVVEWRSNLETGDIPELHVAAEGERKAKMSMILAMECHYERADEDCMNVCPYCNEGNCVDPVMRDCLEVLKELKIAVTAAGVLERYRPAFEELAKGEE